MWLIILKCLSIESNKFIVFFIFLLTKSQNFSLNRSSLFAFIGRVNPKGSRELEKRTKLLRSSECTSNSLHCLQLFGSNLRGYRALWLDQQQMTEKIWNGFVDKADDWKNNSNIVTLCQMFHLLYLLFYTIKNVWKRHIKRAVIEQFRSFLLLKYIALSLFITMNIYLWCKDSGPRPPLFQPPEREWWREIKVITGFFQTCGKKGVIWLMWNALRCSLRNPWRKNTEEQF